MMISLQMSPGVLPSTPILLTCREVILIHAPPDAVSATTSFVTVAKIICGANKIGAIPWSIPGFIAKAKTGLKPNDVAY